MTQGMPMRDRATTAPLVQSVPRARPSASQRRPNRPLPGLEEGEFRTLRFEVWDPAGM
jgi:hypothetical protein